MYDFYVTNERREMIHETEFSGKTFSHKDIDHPVAATDDDVITCVTCGELYYLNDDWEVWLTLNGTVALVPNRLGILE